MACVLCLGFWQLGEGAYIPAKAWLAQELMQRAWERAVEGSERPAPWPWADTWPVARLRALGGDIDLIVLAGGSGRTLAFGPGHLSASALPGLWFATGHFRNGILLAPVTARLVAEGILTGRTPAAFAPFLATRFGSGPTPSRLH